MGFFNMTLWKFYLTWHCDSFCWILSNLNSKMVILKPGLCSWVKTTHNIHNNAFHFFFFFISLNTVLLNLKLLCHFLISKLNILTSKIYYYYGYKTLRMIPSYSILIVCFLYQKKGTFQMATYQMYIHVPPLITAFLYIWKMISKSINYIRDKICTCARLLKLHLGVWGQVHVSGASTFRRQWINKLRHSSTLMTMQENYMTRALKMDMQL